MKAPLPILLLLMAATVRLTAAVPDTVVLLHGLGRGPLSLKRVELALRADGYTVRNLDYPSRSADIVTLADATLGPIFRDTAPANSASVPAHATATRVHIVTHSLGGILVRQYLHDHGVPPTLGRVVMLAPPNAGSEVVDRLRDWKLFQLVNGPAGLRLGTDAASAPRALGPLPSGVEVGVIAGDRTINPLFSALLPSRDDGKVTVAATHVGGEADHLTLPATHTWIMWRGDTVTQIAAFLRDGRFAR
jgi:pimeloyl-ACP methyl ester carboxylesterase